MNRRGWIGGLLACLVSGPRSLQAQRLRARVRVVFEDLELLPEGSRFLDARIAVDGVVLAPRVNAADHVSLLLDAGLREIEVTARIEVDGAVRPLGGMYRCEVQRHHDRLVLQVLMPHLSYAGDRGVVVRRAEEDAVGCRPMGVSDCSRGFGGFWLRVRLAG